MEESSKEHYVQLRIELSGKVFKMSLQTSTSQLQLWKVSQRVSSQKRRKTQKIQKRKQKRANQ